MMMFLPAGNLENLGLVGAQITFAHSSPLPIFKSKSAHAHTREGEMRGQNNKGLTPTGKSALNQRLLPFSVVIKARPMLLSDLFFSILVEVPKSVFLGPPKTMSFANKPWRKFITTKSKMEKPRQEGRSNMKECDPKKPSAQSV